MSVPYTFATATTSIPLSQLDANFSYFANAITVQATTTAMTLDSSGNVGIGTTSPTTKLQVNGGAAIQGAGFPTAGAGIELSYNSGTGLASFQAYDRTGAAWKDLEVNALTQRFGTSGSERMRIDTSGNLLVGTTSSGLSNTNSIAIQPTANTYGNAIINHSSAGTSGSNYLVFGYNASGIGSITQNGTTAVSYNTSSDYRLKENVQPMQNALATVGALKPVTYDWISDKSQGEGFIAHELQAVIPLAVTGDKDAVNEDGTIKPQGVDYSKIVVHLVAAIQELTAEVTALKAKVGA